MSHIACDRRAQPRLLDPCGPAAGVRASHGRRSHGPKLLWRRSSERVPRTGWARSRRVPSTTARGGALRGAAPVQRRWSPARYGYQPSHQSLFQLSRKRRPDYRLPKAQNGSLMVLIEGQQAVLKRFHGYSTKLPLSMVDEHDRERRATSITRSEVRPFLSCPQHHSFVCNASVDPGQARGATPPAFGRESPAVGGSLSGEGLYESTGSDLSSRQALRLKRKVCALFLRTFGR